MAAFYRVTGEAVGQGRRTYTLVPVVGGGAQFKRSCDAEAAPLRIGFVYSQDEIDQRCPDEQGPSSRG